MDQKTYTNRGWQRVLLLIIPYFLVIGGLQFLGFYLTGLSDAPGTLIKTTEQSLVILTLTLIGTVFLLLVFLKNIDKKKFIDLGLHKFHALNDTFTGIWLGFAVMFIGLVILLLTGQIQIADFSFNTYEVMLSIVLFTIISFHEELLVRGYVLQNLMLSFNKYVALVLSSALFSVMHLANPAVNINGVIGLFIAGILLGLCYQRTGSLWLPIAFHFSWNFFQSLFGFNVSGIDQHSIIHLSYHEENIWNGGAFGFEGSVLGSLFQLPLIVFVLLKYRFREKYYTEDNLSKPAID